jgi:iron complex outermembrane receptor protein
VEQVGGGGGRSRGLALLALGLLASPALGAEDLSESAFLGEMPVVLTVSRLAQPADEAPAAVTVIDRQMIRESGAWDLSEVFRLVPGMFVAYHSDRFYATDSTVSYHGLTTNTMAHRMQVMVDGRTIYSPLYGGVIWSDIPVALDDIERIEVVRGPDSASYGANSFMGVINIITRHPAEAQGSYASLSTGKGKEGALARYGGRNGDFVWRLTAGFRNDKGEDADIHNPTSQDPLWVKNKFDDKRVRQLNFRGDYQVDATNSLEVQFGYNGGPRQVGEVNDVYATDKRADNHFEQLRWRRATAGGGEVAVQFYHQVESSTATLLDGGDPTAVPANGDAMARRYELSLQHSFSPTSTTRAVWGGAVRYDKTFAPYYLGVKENTYLWQDRPFHLTQLFGNLEWRVRPDLVFNLGAMGEDNSYTGTDISPRLAANWHFLPGQTLRLGFSKATRTPTVYEKAYEEYWLNPASNKYHPNVQTLRPERVDSTDIGYLGGFGNLDVDFRLFRDAFSELISAEPEQAAITGNLNAGSATIKGFEAQLKWNIGKATRLVYNLSHAVVKSRNNYAEYTNSVPTNNQSLMLSHRFDARWSASLLGYQVSEMHLNDTGSNAGANRPWFLSTYRRWDGRIAYAFETGRTRGELALNIQNLGDDYHYEYRYDNQYPGRAAWLNLRLEL